jgi:monovalent cation:H+ antiporter, CPA1 family
LIEAALRMTPVLDLVALLLVLSALFGWINHRFIHLPHSAGLLLLGLLAALLLVIVGALFPAWVTYQNLALTLKNINFTDVVMNGMLGFLLFAGALNLNLSALRERAWPVLALAFVGTIISTCVVGVAVWLAAWAIGISLPLAWATVFGALISPTDPVAVISMLQHVRVQRSLEIEVHGEALFNDGIGLVLFALTTGIATGASEETTAIGAVLLNFGQQVIGGPALGFVTGYVALRAVRAIDDFAIEVLITLALVTATYAGAQWLGISGPLAVVVAGLVVGHRVPLDAARDATQRNVCALWTLIDKILNSILFLLIGLEVVIVLHDTAMWFILAAAAIPIVLLARVVAVSAPLLLLRWTHSLSVRNVPFLTWAGIRGGISVALALSLPEGQYTSIIVAATYAVVLFSIVVQGSTFGAVARLTLNIPARAAQPPPQLK